MAEAEAHERLQQIWNKTIDELKKGEVNLALWEAVETCVPLALESDTLILGMASEDYHLSGHINNPASAHLVRETLGGVLGAKTSFEVIEGTKPEHWEAAKDRRRRQEDAARRTLAKKRDESVGELATWDQVASHIQGKFSSLKEKNLPWAIAQFLLESLQVVAEAEERMRSAGGADEHNVNRGCARLLNKLAGQTDIPLGTIGLEYIRVKKAREGGT